MHDSDITALSTTTSTIIAVEYSSQFGELMTALAKAQAEMDNPDTDSYNPFFRARYPSMAAVRNVTVPILAKHGIATTQHPQQGEGWIRCITILWHGEQYLKTTMHSPVLKTRREGGAGQIIPIAELNHQDYVAVFNYLRRISLQAVCNIAGEDDDDGQAATGKTTPHQQREIGQERRNVSRRALAPEDGVNPEEDERQAFLTEIWDRHKAAIQPLKHAGMHKAIFFHSFRLDKPELIKQQPLATLEAGMALYRHLTAQVGTWDRLMKPDEWISGQQRLLATEATASEVAPEGVNPDTGEDLRDMPHEFLTAREQEELEAEQERRMFEEAGERERGTA